MREPVRSRHTRRAGITGLVLAAWSSSACNHWKVQSAVPEQVVSRHPQQVRVTRHDSSRIVLRDVAVRRVNVVRTAVLAPGTLVVAASVALGLAWSNRAD